MAALLETLRDRLGPHLVAAEDAGGRVRLQTLVLLRWIAIAGQLLAILFVHFGLDFHLPLLPALAVVGISALLNIMLFVVYPTAKRLTEMGAAGYLAFDLLQLCVLLFLTGGVDNPFSVLILVPVTVSATILSLRSTVMLGGLAFVLAALLTLYHYPLPWGEGSAIQLPATYQWGTFLALTLGTLFIAAYAWQVAEEARRMSDALAATQMALAREQQVSALGSLAAAAAHELGSPLGTIAVVVREMRSDVEPGSPLAEDVALLQSQVERCREILARLARRPSDEADAQTFTDLGIANLVEMAAQPWRRAAIAFDIEPKGAGEPPILPRRPEIIHGLSNLLQNAMEFARSRVAVHINWNERTVSLDILDDGPGLNVDILSALGEPYVTSRPDSGGMGLGVFIAKNLLHRSGATVAFANRVEGGTRVTVTWPRSALGK
ncbi:MAG TPA: ActS/PrrB/RegB family redox-sensitive histidine kinase [Ferrovibrio sp.]|jgi:two-component system sensor histidine kinase RegB|uniref:ActS/PrrB/RegB family redox-sensitive histidine kinase n=1 Tax=Ferrovibrio sp. TaxID=1917215 RepID=UPI002ED102DB